MRAARDEDGNYYTVPSDMTYREWEKQAVNGQETTVRENNEYVKPITKITNKAIDNIPHASISGYSDEQCDYIHSQHQELLKFAKENNNGNEVSFAFSSDFSKKSTYIGSDNRISMKFEGIGSNLFVMHNHPRNGSYSMEDLATFLDDSIKTVTIVKNNGHIEILTKSKSYDKTVLQRDFVREIKKRVKQQNSSEYDKAIKNVLLRHSKERGMLQWIKL